jgi:flagellin-like protein
MTPSTPEAVRLGERGVSPVVGAVLMVAIVILLAAVLSTMALGFEDELQEPAPSGAFDQEYVASGTDNTDDRPYVTITHNFGKTADADNIIIKDDAGNTIRWNDVWTGGPEVRAGEYVHIDGFQSDSALQPICEKGDSYWIIWEADDGDELVVNKWTAPSDPNLPPSSSSDDDGDGIPNWC